MLSFDLVYSSRRTSPSGGIYQFVSRVWAFESVAGLLRKEGSFCGCCCCCCVASLLGNRVPAGSTPLPACLSKAVLPDVEPSMGDGEVD